MYKLHGQTSNDIMVVKFYAEKCDKEKTVPKKPFHYQNHCIQFEIISLENTLPRSTHRCSKSHPSAHFGASKTFTRHEKVATREISQDNCYHCFNLEGIAKEYKQECSHSKLPPSATSCPVKTQMVH